MNETVARARAEAARPRVPVPEDYEMGAPEKRIIQLAERSRDAASVTDRLVWIVRFQGFPRSVEVAIDDASGDVVRVRWSK